MDFNKFDDFEETDEEIDENEEELDTESQEEEEIDEEAQFQKEKTLTQREVDKIVEKRLARERGKYGDYQDLKEIAESLVKYGYSGSVREIKEQLKEAVDIANKEEELSKLQNEADKSGTSPELLLEIKELKKELTTLKNERNAETEKQNAAVEAEAHFQKQLGEFREKYQNVSVKDLSDNPKFMRFAKRSNPESSLIDIYEDYLELVEGVEKEAIAKMQSKAARGTNSGRGKNNAEGATFGLTPRQQSLAKSGGMTNKEYAQYLRDLQ